MSAITGPGRRPCQIEALAAIQSRYKVDKESNISMCTGSGKTYDIVDACHLPDVNRAVLVFPSLPLLKQFHRDHKGSFSDKNLVYFATEDTLHGIRRISAAFIELAFDTVTILTTYISAPVLMATLSDKRRLDMLINDEAHHITAPVYSVAYTRAVPFIQHTVNFSATLPCTKEPNYKYPLLKGIRDSVVRDFNIELFICKSEEDTGLLQIIDKLVALHNGKAKILIYTAEANTDGSSVRTFMARYAAPVRARGWWIQGINADTDDKDRDPILREFEADKSPASILVSCRTLSEGIDLKNANCMLPWDPSASITVNIQRIGRVVRLYKTAAGAIAKEQPPSTILIPVFLEEADYAACSGDRAAVHALLEKQISEGEKGNFRPIVNVCTALKSELAEEDSDLFNQLLNYPFTPKVRVDKDLVTCVSAQLKKPVEDVLEEVAAALTEKGELEEETIDAIREGDISQEDAGAVITALAESQDIRLVIRDKDEEEVVGKGSKEIFVERKGEGVYTASKKKSDAAVRQRVAHRLRTSFSDGCKILLGLEAVDLDAMEGLVLARLTAEVQIDEDWEKRRLEWAAFYKSNERGPLQSSSNKQEVRAAQWQGQQRNHYKQKMVRLTPERITALEETDGWKWFEEDKWELRRLTWAKFTEELGHPPTVHSADSLERKSAQWACDQRLYYRRKMPTMTLAKITSLEATSGWYWNKEDTFEAQRQLWKDMYTSLGNRRPSQSSTNESERKAAEWQSNQRAKYRRNDSSLTKEKINKLEETTGWTWEEEDAWGLQHQLWVDFYKLNGTRRPSQKSKIPAEKALGVWQTNQRVYYRSGDARMTAERKEKLIATEGWVWEEEDTWEINRVHWAYFFKTYKCFPKQTSTDKDERTLSNWQNKQRRAYTNKEPSLTDVRIAALNATPGWSWSANSPPVTPALTVGDVIEHVNDDDVEVEVPERKRHIPSAKAAVSSHTLQERERSQLELLHKAYKTRNADTYFSLMQTDPAKFEEYHAVADVHDARDPPERKPQNKIAEMLKKNNRASYKAIDLGCGRNHLRTDERVSKMSWTSVDVVAADSTVTVADMGNLPFEDESFDRAILNRSLWAKNHMTVLHEVWRILKVGCRAIICESFQRWFTEGENELLTAVKTAGFTVISEEGTTPDSSVSVFQYIEVRKD